VTQPSELRFLVAEDHEFQRRALARLLTRQGALQVREAADGQAALDIIGDSARAFDIVICDLDMPGMDGMEFLRRLGQIKAPMSVILSSALDRALLSSVATMAEAYGIALLGVIEKPLTLAKLVPLLQNHRPGESGPPATNAVAPVFTLEEITAGLLNDEFEPYFQPQVNLATGRVHGAEALARWKHPARGVIAPASFIAVLEENGMIDALTWTMLKKSARMARTWRDAGLSGTISVNLSLKSLAQPGLAERVTQLVRGQGLEPRHMTLEVTESAAATEVGPTLENLARLRMKGFGLSIDDYGTGYSSMQQLMRIAFTELKVDQSFVALAARESAARVILESSLKMARKLHICSVAEGVETRAAYDLLCQLQCDVAQGYFIARPMEADAYPGWVGTWR
jgi:EAL domain-containing protein (putative c-di-GMP-specific phosphodiesterase class I)/ActR/RegA family two-component response regulator